LIYRLNNELAFKEKQGDANSPKLNANNQSTGSHSVFLVFLSLKMKTIIVRYLRPGASKRLPSSEQHRKVQDLPIDDV